MVVVLEMGMVALLMHVFTFTQENSCTHKFHLALGGMSEFEWRNINNQKNDDNNKSTE